MNSQDPCLFSFSLFARNTDLKSTTSALSLREIIRYLCFSTVPNSALNVVNSAQKSKIVKVGDRSCLRIYFIVIRTFEIYPLNKRLSKQYSIVNYSTILYSRSLELVYLVQLKLLCPLISSLPIPDNPSLPAPSNCHSTF